MPFSGHDRLAQQFASAGFEADDAWSRARLLAETLDAFTTAANRPPAWSWFVPGRIEIFGKHTDYAGGRSLTCTVPRGFAIAAAPRDDGRVRVVDARLGGEAMVDPGEELREGGGWAAYVDVVARRLARDFPGAPLGAEIAMASDLPRAAGLSSSSALVVGLATALVRRGELDRRSEWAAVRAVEDLAGYLGAVENGLTFKSFGDAAGVGTLGGSEDHTAILMARAGRVSAYSYLPVVRQGDADMPRDWAFVVAASGLEADKAGSVREQYNSVSRATRIVLERLNARTGGAHPHLAAALQAADPDVIVEMIAGGDLALGSRLAHFIAEDERVTDALDAFRSGDRRRLSDLSRSSQDQAQMLLGNQVPETIALADLAHEHGAFAASSFGAGFGGSVWALVNADGAGGFADRWLTAYAAAFPAISGASAFVCRPAPAAIEVAIGG
jgi:galactokinase